ncbi:MAG TPA: L,D-transpeptidase family protein [Chthoniobacteraceae bacterium]|jgi:lipoprotein-anchoring transpeptidase ErfK/SrfK|nr:L,D-transpeptidase family protein [Chthoniobacteraceae bacterium]
MRTCGAFKVLLGFVAILCLSQTPGRAQLFGRQAPRMKPADELIHKQEPAKLTPRVLDLMTPDNSHVVVSISRQRVYLMMGDEIGIDSPISSGKAGHETPTGHFTVQEKDPDHRSSLYGAFCDNRNRIVRAGVSLHIDSAPSGTHFIGAPMLWFCRFHDAIGMHVGILPGYAASHGCVRLPPDIAPLIYNKVKVGTQVDVQQ